MRDPPEHPLRRSSLGGHRFVTASSPVGLSPSKMHSTTETSAAALPTCRILWRAQHKDAPTCADIGCNDHCPSPPCLNVAAICSYMDYSGQLGLPYLQKP